MPDHKPIPPGDADRNLLFGVIALQAELISPEQFIEACTLWTARKDLPLAQLLVERGWILAADRTHLEYLLDRKLKKPGGGLKASLAAIPEGVKLSLASLDDADIMRSLAGNGSAPADPRLALTVDEPPGCVQRYTRTYLHAKGGIGQVWFTRDALLGRSIALKELRPEGAANPGLVARFLREAQVTGQLEHPGIVPVYEMARWPQDGQPFYTMRFVKGRTLTEAARQFHQQRLTAPADACELPALLNAFVTVCNTVAYAHSRGVIHRDLKGQNVIVGQFGEVVVLDWGLAKVTGGPEGESEASLVMLGQDQAAEPGLTLQGDIIGTPGYMAPEQAEGRLDLIDRHTDVYGLGAILYEILTGQPPFTGTTREEVFRKLRTEEPVRPHQFWAEIPPALEAFCLRALAKKPAARHASASDLACEVQNWQEVQRRQAEEALRQANTALARSNEELKQLAADLQERSASERRTHQQLVEVQQRQLAQAEQLARLGRMVAGITHEVHDRVSSTRKAITLLQSDVRAFCDLIRLYEEGDATLAEHEPQAFRRIELLRDRIDLPSKVGQVEELVTHSRNSLARVQQVIKDFRHFAAVDENRLEVTDLNAAIEPAINIVRDRAQRLGVHLVEELGRLPVVTFYPTEINQMVLNLLNNAIDACPGGGRVTVCTCAGPDRVEIHVIDTGPGIDAEIRDKIFEPFFTTKPPGLGRGLGLCICSLIAEKHGGGIEVKSASGPGAHFLVRLPLQAPLQTKLPPEPGAGAGL